MYSLLPFVHVHIHVCRHDIPVLFHLSQVWCVVYATEDVPATDWSNLNNYCSVHIAEEIVRQKYYTRH